MLKIGQCTSSKRRTNSREDNKVLQIQETFMKKVHPIFQAGQAFAK